MLQGTLLQLHYHNRPGGVSTVMISYAHAFARLCAGRKFQNSIICNVDESVIPNPSINYEAVPDCDYKTFKNKKVFLQKKNKLHKTIARIVTDPQIPHPIYVVGHNLNLGKNSALSAAFSEMAIAMENQPEIRFFSVIHDFAEQGRTDLLLSIQRLEKTGVSVWNYLYPCAKKIQYMCINDIFFKVMKQSGFPVLFLPNQIGREICQNDKSFVNPELFKRKIFKLAPNVLDENKPVCLYPVRVISRKNPVEAIMIAHFFHGANLLFGSTGTSSQDISLSALLQDICKKHSVSVLFNSFQYISKLGLSIEGMFQLADYCISTSLAEGFGYALHDPKQYNKPLIARQPLGIASSKHFYKRFYIPLAWVDEEKILEQYYSVHTTICGKATKVQEYSAFAALFRKTFTTDTGIDFGCLDNSTQIAVLRYCLHHPDAVDMWKKMFPAQTRFLKDSSDMGQKKSGNSHGFSRDTLFLRCMKYKTRTKTINQNPQGIVDYFKDVSRFYLLLNPQKPDLHKNNAVFT